MDSVPNPLHDLKCELASEVLRSWGTLNIRVTGWSMLPAVMPGDTLTVERTLPGAITEGDIVLFGRDRRLCAHRVIRAGQAPDVSVVTRGDAMPASDRPISDAELLGKVSCIVRDGKIIDAGNGPRFLQRALAALMRRSILAARVFLGLHGLRQGFHNSWGKQPS